MDRLSRNCSFAFRQDYPKRELSGRAKVKGSTKMKGRMLGVSYKDRVGVQLFPSDKWVAEYCSGKFDAISTYSLKEADGGTQLDVVTEVEFKGWLGPFGGLVKRGIERTIEKKWNEYLRIVEEESRKG